MVFHASASIDEQCKAPITFRTRSTDFTLRRISFPCLFRPQKNYSTKSPPKGTVVFLRHDPSHVLMIDQQSRSQFIAPAKLDRLIENHGMLNPSTVFDATGFDSTDDLGVTEIFAFNPQTFEIPHDQAPRIWLTTSSPYIRAKVYSTDSRTPYCSRNRV